MAREGIETFWNAVASPGGNYLLISYSPRSGKDKRFELADTGAMRVVRAWTDPGFGGVHASAPFDDGDVLAKNGSGGTLVAGPPEGPWRPVRVDWDPRCKPGDYRPINDQTILASAPVAIDRWCYSLDLTTGGLLFTQELGEKEIVRSLAVSADGQRFALAIYRGKGGSWGLDIPAHYSLNRIKVYDIPSRQWIFALDGKKQGIKSISGLAVSPDGSLLSLINQDGMLRVYRIPQKPGG